MQWLSFLRMAAFLIVDPLHYLLTKLTMLMYGQVSLLSRDFNPSKDNVPKSPKLTSPGQKKRTAECLTKNVTL